VEKSRSVEQLRAFIQQMVPNANRPCNPLLAALHSGIKRCLEEKLGNCLWLAWEDEIRNDLAERLQNKAPQVGARMRENKIVGRSNLIAKGNQV
jgi:hypothetical protein